MAETGQVSDLKKELSSLQIDRDQPVRSPWRWPLLLFVPALLGLGGLYVIRIRSALSAPEVETVRPSVTTGPTSSAAGTPVLTAAGYVVPRRKAVVSAKIQGRLAELKVEEGSRVRKDEIVAQLENADFIAAEASARAAVQRAEADLLEQQRQLRRAAGPQRPHVP